MRAEQDNRIMKALGVLAIALLVLFLSPSEGRAVTGSDICGSLDTYGGATFDYDNDGFTNGEECNYITIVGSFGGGGYFPGYNNRGQQLPRTGYLDPAGMDLFLILVRANNTLIPADSPTTIYSNGLPVTIHVHEITSSAPETDRSDRSVTSTQKAVKITESLNTAGTIFGDAQQGTPNGEDGATVYTQEIKDFVIGRCTTGYQCNANPNTAGVPSVTGIEPVTNLYIRNVIAHELGHVSKLTPAKDRRFEWHYAPGSGTVMEQSASYTKSNSAKTVTFYLSTQYTPPDIAGVIFKGQ